MGECWNQVADAEAKVALEPFFMLCLDCSKVYNNVDNEWLMLCLEPAGLPEQLQRLVRDMLVNASIFLLNRVEHEPFDLSVDRKDVPPRASCT